MKTIVLHEATELQSLAQRLAGTRVPVERVAASLTRLNPQLAAGGRLPAGSVLLLDEALAEEDASAGGPQVAALASELKAMLADALEATERGLASRAAERKAVADALKQPALKRVIDADVELSKRAAGAAADLKKEQTQDKETEQSVRQLHAEALKQIDALFKALG
jgi:hypothetical protein